MLLVSTKSVSFLLLPNSNAAIIDMAFASPMPLNLDKSCMDNLAKAFKSFLQEFKMRLLKSTADSVVEPELINMATNSASDNARLPCKLNFSRGRSSSAQVLMVILFS